MKAWIRMRTVNSIDERGIGRKDDIVYTVCSQPHGARPSRKGGQSHPITRREIESAVIVAWRSAAWSRTEN